MAHLMIPQLPPRRPIEVVLHDLTTGALVQRLPQRRPLPLLRRHALLRPHLLVIGADPPDGHYDLCRGTPAEHARARETIPHVPLPQSDPVFGRDGPLMKLWGG